MGLGLHPGWYVSGFGRRPLSVSVAAGSPVSSFNGLEQSLTSDAVCASGLPESPCTFLFGGLLDGHHSVPATVE